MDRLNDVAFTGAMTTHQPAPILVLGGTGKSGRRVAQRLADRGLPVRIGSRSADPPFDWGRPDTWPAVVEGAGAVYIAYSPDLAFPGAAETVAAVASLALDRGVRRVVLLSGRGEDGARAAEEMVAAAATAAGVPWTVVRASWFAQNFSEDFLAGMVLDGTIAVPAGDIAEPFIDADDIADVAVAALTEPGHDNRIYEVTGPRLLTFDDAAAELTAATGREIRFQSVAPDEFIKAALASGVAEDLAHGLVALFTEILDGRNAHLDDGVQQALGRPARDFADFARDAAAAGAWSAAA